MGLPHCPEKISIFTIIQYLKGGGNVPPLARLELKNIGPSRVKIFPQEEAKTLQETLSVRKYG